MSWPDCVQRVQGPIADRCERWSGLFSAVRQRFRRLRENRRWVDRTACRKEERAALAALLARLNSGENREHAVALGMLLWTTPVAMMIAEMFATVPLSTKDAQAVADLIDAHR